MTIFSIYCSFIQVIKTAVFTIQWAFSYDSVLLLCDMERGKAGSILPIRARTAIAVS